MDKVKAALRPASATIYDHTIFHHTLLTLIVQLYAVSCFYFCIINLHYCIKIIRFSSIFPIKEENRSKNSIFISNCVSLFTEMCYNTHILMLKISHIKEKAWSQV